MMWKLPKDKRDRRHIEIDGFLVDSWSARNRIVQTHNSEVRRLKEEIRAIERERDVLRGRLDALGEEEDLTTEVHGNARKGRD